MTTDIIAIYECFYFYFHNAIFLKQARLQIYMRMFLIICDLRFSIILVRGYLYAVVFMHNITSGKTNLKNVYIWSIDLVIFVISEVFSLIPKKNPKKTEKH